MTLSSNRDKTHKCAGWIKEGSACESWAACLILNQVIIPRMGAALQRIGLRKEDGRDSINPDAPSVSCCCCCFTGSSIIESTTLYGGGGCRRGSADLRPHGAKSL